jgi:hypothetical protein
MPSKGSTREGKEERGEREKEKVSHKEKKNRMANRRECTPNLVKTGKIFQ